MIRKRIIEKKVLKDFQRRNVQYGQNITVNGKILLSDRLNLTLGNDVKINSGYINPVGHEIATSFYTVGDAEIVIGNHVGISNTTFYARAGIYIEDNVLIGGGCRIYDTDFHALEYSERIEGSVDGIVSKQIRIARGAFIGAHTIILKGVHIGAQSIIGAGAVVTKSVPEGEILPGNPAIFNRKI